MPISCSFGTPVTLTAASLASVIFPSALMVTSGSSDASISERTYVEVASCCSSTRLRSVMSRAMEETPTTWPAAPRIGETVSETLIDFPSLRLRWVS